MSVFKLSILLNKASTLSIYRHGKNDNDVISDALNALLTLNDNDVLYAKKYKKKSSRRFNEEELQKVICNTGISDLVILNRETGTLFNAESLRSPGDPEE